jgi:LacI family transcriptional regulator
MRRKGTAVKRTTIGDVAAEARVSVATVSRVLNGGAVRHSTAARVREAASRLEYTPNALTKSIFAGRSSTIGVVIDDLRSPFYLELMRGIDEVAGANGSLVMFASTFQHVGREAAQVQAMDEQRVRGLIVTTAARPVPDPPPGLHSVALDNTTAGRLIAEHLTSCGRRSVGVITSGGRPSQLDRTRGLRQGLAEAGLPLPGEAVISIEGNEQARDAVEALLGRRAPTDVIVCLTGRRTVAVHSVLASRGLAIPGDIGFLTMDDFSWAPALGITVIAQPAYQMGQKAAELIVENPGRPARLTFEPQLIARTSCGENS